jgi:hypothetical protein
MVFAALLAACCSQHYVNEQTGLRPYPASLTVVRTATPRIRQPSPIAVGCGGAIGLAAGIGLDAGARLLLLREVPFERLDWFDFPVWFLGLVLVYGGMAVAEEMAIDVDWGGAGLDIGQKIGADFCNWVSAEIPSWPPMAVLNDPIAERCARPPGPVLEFRVEYLAFRPLSGVVCVTSAAITDSLGIPVWHKRFKYKSAAAGRRPPGEPSLLDAGFVGPSRHLRSDLSALRRADLANFYRKELNIAAEASAWYFISELKR